MSSIFWNITPCWKSTDVSREYVVSIFRAKEYAKVETSTKQAASLFGLLYDPEAGGDTFLRIVMLSPNHTGSKTQNQFDFGGLKCTMYVGNVRFRAFNCVQSCRI
jgi:hypothetical protein